MRRVLFVTASCIVAASIVLAAQSTPGAKRWFSHIEVLASDAMEGRDTGSPGHRRAADYVITQFQEAGLEPAGTSGYRQAVPFKARRIDESESSLTLIGASSRVSLTLGEDANFSLRVDPAARVEAPLVFVGYGVNVPESGLTDLNGLDLR